jgi:hypothetical protein
MRKVILLLILISSLNSNAQWIVNKVDNGLDDPYKICYNENQYGEFLKMENVDNQIKLYVYDSSVCKEFEIKTDISFFVNGEWKRHHYICNYIFEESIEINPDLLSKVNESFVRDFKSSTKIKFRFNYDSCEPEIYEFDMSGSAAALNFISKQ